jgi:hypothetical protein
MTAIADRLLDVLVPHTRAGACCPPDPWEERRCRECYTEVRYCSYTCACRANCGPWTQTSEICALAPCCSYC